jgi:hypothetical protein
LVSQFFLQMCWVKVPEKLWLSKKSQFHFFFKQFSSTVYLKQLLNISFNGHWFAKTTRRFHKVVNLNQLIFKLSMFQKIFINSENSQRFTFSIYFRYGGMSGTNWLKFLISLFFILSFFPDNSALKQTA